MGTPILTITDGNGERALGQLSHGDKGVTETIGAMFALVHSAQRASVVRDVANAAKDAAGVYAYVRDRVYFKRDPEGVERLQAPDAMLRSIRETGQVQGDCDDAAMLVAALIQAQGGTPVFVVVAMPSPTNPARFAHVFAGVMRDPSGELTRANVVPLDPQERARVPFGVWPKPCGPGAKKCVSRTRLYRWNGAFRW